MPRAKRTLAETNTNATDSAPAPKRSSTGKTTSAVSGDKENVQPGTDAASVPDYTKMSNAELKALLKDRSLSQRGTKLEMIARLREAGWGKNSSSTDETTANRSGKIPPRNKSSDLQFICHSKSDEDDSDGESEDPGTEMCINWARKEITGKAAEEVPGWKWLISTKGAFLAAQYGQDMMRRNQDVFDMHHYEDWNGNAVTEIFENALIAFHKDFTKKKTSSEVLWPHIEGMIWFWIKDADVVHWLSQDDGGTYLHMVEMLGRAVLSTVGVLVREDKFRNEGSRIKNVAIVLSYWISFALEARTDSEDDISGWARVLVKIADAQGLNITGAVGIEEGVNKLRKEADEMNPEDDVWAGSFDWNAEFTKYCDEHGTGPGKYRIGGTSFDLSKMSRKERLNHPASIGPGPILDSDIDPDVPPSDVIMRTGVRCGVVMII